MKMHNYKWVDLSDVDKHLSKGWDFVEFPWFKGWHTWIRPYKPVSSKKSETLIWYDEEPETKKPSKLRALWDRLVSIMDRILNKEF
jgi:hypothetical protein